MYEAVKVADFPTKVEAQRAGRILESEGIPYLIRPERAPADPASIIAVIYVAPDIARRAKEVLGVQKQAVT
jgi:hypothetical protein